MEEAKQVEKPSHTRGPGWRSRRVERVSGEAGDGCSPRPEPAARPLGDTGEARPMEQAIRERGQRGGVI